MSQDVQKGTPCTSWEGFYLNINGEKTQTVQESLQMQSSAVRTEQQELCMLPCQCLRGPPDGETRDTATQGRGPWKPRTPEVAEHGSDPSLENYRNQRP